MLTKEKAIEFLQDSWRIQNVQLQLETDRETLLNKLILCAYQRIPFHTLFAFMPPEWQVKGFCDINKWCMSGLGGHCGLVSPFIWHLLTVLGFNAYITMATVTKPESLNVHVIVIVKDLVKSGDYHLVDCGLGQPSFTAISLNFNKESPVYKESYLEYKYIKEDGLILRMHGNGDLVKHSHPPKRHDYYQGKWRRYYIFTLERVTIENFRKYVDIRYRGFISTPSAATFHNSKAVLIMNGNMLFIEQEDGTLLMTTLKSKDEIFSVYEKYFPTIAKDIFKQAYSTWYNKMSKI